MIKTVFKIGGMVCDGCASNVERTMLGIPGIISCTVNYSSEQATIQYNPKHVDIVTIQQEVEDVGFTIQLS
ncbi:MAG: heavy metal-associated domain-containing protein [Cyanobacteria bacterium J06626_14]